MTSYDSTRCVICYENKAKWFCIDCKSSSGVCNSCYNDWDDVMFNEGAIESYLPMPCPVCKIPMRYSKLNFMFNFDLMSAGELFMVCNERKKEKLVDIVFNAIELGKDKKKKKKKKKIYLISKK